MIERVTVPRFKFQMASKNKKGGFSLQLLITTTVRDMHPRPHHNSHSQQYAASLSITRIARLKFCFKWVLHCILASALAGGDPGTVSLTDSRPGGSSSNL